MSSWHKYKRLGQIYIGKVKKVIYTEQWLSGIIHMFLATLPFKTYLPFLADYKKKQLFLVAQSSMIPRRDLFSQKQQAIFDV